MRRRRRRRRRLRRSRLGEDGGDQEADLYLSLPLLSSTLVAFDVSPDRSPEAYLTATPATFPPRDAFVIVHGPSRVVKP